MVESSGSVLQRITSFLVGKGLTPAQAAGVEGNFYIESRFDPTAYNAKEGAIGLAQWEGDRRTKLQQYARSQGRTETDLMTQLGFLWQELQGPEKSALSALRGAGSASEAAAVFDQKFERSSGASRQGRVDAANSIYKGVALPNGTSVKGAKDDGTSTTDVLGSIFVPGYGAIDQASDGAVSSWAGEGLAIGVKLLGTVGALALVVAGVMHTVKDGN